MNPQYLRITKICKIIDISVIDEYNAFRNYYAEHEMKNTRDRFNRVEAWTMEFIYSIDSFI